MHPHKGSPELTPGQDRPQMPLPFFLSGGCLMTQSHLFIFSLKVFIFLKCTCLIICKSYSFLKEITFLFCRYHSVRHQLLNWSGESPLGLNPPQRTPGHWRKLGAGVFFPREEHSDLLSGAQKVSSKNIQTSMLKEEIRLKLYTYKNN